MRWRVHAFVCVRAKAGWGTKGWASPRRPRDTVEDCLPLGLRSPAGPHRFVLAATSWEEHDKLHVRAHAMPIGNHTGLSSAPSPLGEGRQDDGEEP